MVLIEYAVCKNKAMNAVRLILMFAKLSSEGVDYEIIQTGGSEFFCFNHIAFHSYCRC